MLQSNRNIAVELTLAGRRHGAEDGGDSVISACQHRKCRVCEQRVACPDGIDELVDKAVDHEIAVQRVVLLIATGQNAAFPELEDQELAARLVVDEGRKRANAGVLVANGETCLALVRCDQIEALEFSDVSPT